MAKVEFIRAAIDDLEDLDGDILKRALKKILQLEKNPEAGQPLGRSQRTGTKLTTFRKLVLGNRDWRVIYRIEPGGDVSVVWLVGDRSDDECYREAADRLERASDSATKVALEDLLTSLAARKQRIVRKVLE